MIKMAGKLIIVEGIDGSGKTTLIEGLRRLGAFDYHFNYSYPKEAEMFQCGAFAKGEYAASIRIFKQLLQRDYTIVCDRFHLGEYAYGPIMRGYPEFFAKKIVDDTEKQILADLKEFEVYVVILHCNPITISRRKDLRRAVSYTHLTLPTNREV